MLISNDYSCSSVYIVPPKFWDQRTCGEQLRLNTPVETHQVVAMGSAFATVCFARSAVPTMEESNELNIFSYFLKNLLKMRTYTFTVSQNVIRHPQRPTQLTDFLILLFLMRKSIVSHVISFSHRFLSIHMA